VGGSYTYSSTNNGISSAASADDILYSPVIQTNHGDRPATATLSPVLLSNLVNTWQVATTAWSGYNQHVGYRALYSEYTLGSYSAYGDGYIVQVTQSDSIPDEGSYSFTLAVQQIVPITIIANA
jgi:hypothetical protein